ncbi:hypothetical protein [Ruegeria arenilitoris]|uniref:hypothetical protein n=1 Tax=Ruegeria arenilitoris TaxID=1173585 RepID=UPI00147CA3E3|nr:hypothetical protein [Ruegeria arenilitoris]
MSGQSRTGFASAALVLLLSKSALGCQPMHQVNYKTDGGYFDIRLNGVLVMAGDSYSGVVKLDQGLMDGENTITVTYDAKGAQDVAYFAVHEGCEGEFPNEQSLASVEIHGDGEQELVFDSQSPVEAFFPGAVISDGKGLLDAVKELQAAVQRRDVETVFAFHEPLLTKMAESGAPMERINAHVTKMLTEGEITLMQNLTLTPVLDGLAWEVLAPSSQPPVVVHLEQDGGQYEWTSGTRWVFVDNAWYVIEP